MATRSNLFVEQGANFVVNVEVENDIDLTEFTGRGQFRKHFSSSTARDLNIEILDGSNLLISLDPADTDVVKPGRYVYDVEIEDGDGNIYRVLEGEIIITPGVTHD